MSARGPDPDSVFFADSTERSREAQWAALYHAAMRLVREQWRFKITEAPPSPHGEPARDA